MDFIMSKHAIDRALDMAVDGQEIRDAFERPRDKYFSARTQSWWLTRGRVTLAVSTAEPPVVTTILPATAAAWAADQEFEPLEGRESRDNSGVRRVRKAIRRSR